MSKRSGATKAKVEERRERAHTVRAVTFLKKYAHDDEACKEKACRNSKHFTVKIPPNPIIKVGTEVERPTCKNCKKEPRRHASAYCGECK